MKATRFCLSVVRRGHAPSKPALGEGIDGVSPFLVSHMDDLFDGAHRDRAPRTKIPVDVNRDRFEALRVGPDEDFLAAADELAHSLSKEMSHVNAKDGVLVCVTYEDSDGARYGAALKLQVVSDHGAVLEKLASGETVLSAIHQVLDRPGELQKGIIVPDPRSASAAVVGDKANATEARYFLLAMGVEAEQHAKKALSEVATALLSHVDSAKQGEMLGNLMAADTGPVAQVAVAAAKGLIAPEVVELVVGELEGRERPIRLVDTRAPLKTTISAGGIKITLWASDLDRVTIEPASDGGWLISLRVDSEPDVSYRS